MPKLRRSAQSAGSELEFACATDGSGDHRPGVDADADSKVTVETLGDQALSHDSGTHGSISMIGQIVGCAEDRECARCSAAQRRSGPLEPTRRKRLTRWTFEALGCRQFRDGSGARVGAVKRGRAVGFAQSPTPDCTTNSKVRVVVSRRCSPKRRAQIQDPHH
jgi:hypothetical protein